jgi:phosphotransferase system HPr-like phosphotransfer protein
MEFQVMLTSVSDVKDFVDATAACPSDIDVHSGRYVVNGKSIMCLFSLDLSVPVKVALHGDGEGEKAFREKVKKFIVE